jgi:hypothetical protein
MLMMIALATKTPAQQCENAISLAADSDPAVNPVPSSATTGVSLVTTSTFSKSVAPTTTKGKGKKPQKDPMIPAKIPKKDLMVPGKTLTPR